MTTFSRTDLSTALGRMSTDPRPNADPQRVYREMEAYGDPVVEGAAEMIVYLRMRATGHDIKENPPFAFLCRALVLSGYQLSALLLGLPPRPSIGSLEPEVSRLIEEWQPVGLDIQREWFEPQVDPDDDWDDDDLDDLGPLSEGWMPHNDLSIHANWCVRGLTQTLLEAGGVDLRSTDESEDNRFALGLLNFNDGIVLAAADWHLYGSGRR